MRRRPTSHRFLLLVVGVGVLLATAWYVGSRFDAPAPPPAVGTVRLGPESGEPVADYLARLPAQLPEPGVDVPALVQLGTELTPDEAVALLAGADRTASADLVSVVFHVPLPRVQTALRFTTPDPGNGPTAALAAARERAWFAAGSDAARRTGRPAQVAAVEAAALADPGCRCVLALLVRADRAGLDALAVLPGVRAVHAAPPGVTPGEPALAPLLPEQVERAGPVPDDGPVPRGKPLDDGP